MSIITSFRAGLAFFTRIPVGSAPLPPTLSGVVAWLPAVGLLVGALAALALLLVAWATGSGKIGELFDAVIGQLISKAG